MASEPDVVELTKALLLEFAKAVYICQCFESSLCLLLSLMAQQKNPEHGVFQASWDFNSRKTLGQLVQRLREQIEVPEKLDEYLRVGVDKRNQIIHGYLTKNALRLADPKERLEMEAELRQMKVEVKKRDIVVNKLIDTLLAKYGTSNESLKRGADRYWQQLNPAEGDDFPH